MKLVRIAAAAAGGLLIVAAIALIAVAWLFEPNDYKDRLAAEFERRTGRSLEIEQPLELGYVPWLAVETGGVVVGNAAGFSERDFARIESLSARIGLLPLVLERRVRFGTIVVDGLALNLEVDAQGRGNWLLADGAEAAPADSGDDTTGPGWLETLNADGVRIRNAELTWRDLATGQAYTVRDLALTTGAYSPGAPVDVELAFGLSGAGAGLDASVATHASVDYDAGAGLAIRNARAELAVSEPERFEAELELRFDALDWRMDGPLTLTGTELSGSLDMAALGTDPRELSAASPRIELDPATGTASIDSLTAALGALELSSRIRAELPPAAAAPRVTGTLAIEQAPLAATLTSFGLALPDGVDAAALGNFDLAAAFDLALDPLGLEVADLEARALGGMLSGEATLSGTGPRLRATFAVPAFEPNEAWRLLAAAHVPEGVRLEAFDRIALSGNVDFDAATRAIGLHDLSAELIGARFTGRADISALDGDLDARGRIATDGISARRALDAFGPLLTDTVDADELGTLTFDTAFRYESAAERLTLDPLELGVFGLRAAGSLTASALTSAPRYTGTARIAEIAPRELMRRFGQTPPRTSDPRALASASLETAFEIGPERGEFRELVLVLDETRITGDFTVEDFLDPSYAFDLSADRLDADRYLPPPADEADADARAAGDLELSGEALDVLRIDGRVSVGELGLAGLDFAGVETRIELGRGRFRLEDAQADLYGGSFAGAFGVDSSGETPRMSLTGRATRIAVAPLVTALQGDSSFSGRGDFDISLEGSGPTVTENMRSATGTMGFTLREGAIEGFDLGRALCATYNTTQRLPQPPDPEVARTRYTLLRGTANVDSGVARSPDLLARTAFMDVTGRGSLDLLEQTLDYRLEAELTGPIEIQRCESMDGLVGESIPLTLRGTLTAPQILPDFGEILKRRVEDTLRERATEGLEERVRERLRELF